MQLTTLEKTVQQAVNLRDHLRWQLVDLHDAGHQIGLDEGRQQLEDLTGLLRLQPGQRHGNGLRMFLQQCFGDGAVIHDNLTIFVHHTTISSTCK